MPKPMSDKLPPAVRDKLAALGYQHLSELSDKAQLHRQTIHNIFNRNKLDRVRIFLSLAHTLQIAPDELLDLIESQSNTHQI